jgi:hypothetical protein
MLEKNAENENAEKVSVGKVTSTCKAFLTPVDLGSIYYISACSVTATEHKLKEFRNICVVALIAGKSPHRICVSSSQFCSGLILHFMDPRYIGKAARCKMNVKYAER